MSQVQQRLAYWFVSGVIIVILGAQAYATFFSAYLKGWPIMSYHMYSNAHYDGERLDHDYVVSVVLEDGSEVPLDRSAMNMEFWVFHNNIFLPIRQKNLEKLTPTIHEVCSRYNDRVIALTARDLGIAITRNGPSGGLPAIESGNVTVTCDRNKSS